MNDPQKEFWIRFFGKNTLDLRSGSHRHMDQKCTPDIIYLISECALDLFEKHPKAFTGKGIADSELFKRNLQFYFNKPDPSLASVANEIDKVVSQPLKTLTFAGVLIENRVGRSYEYSVNDEQALRLLASNERNCFKFLCAFNERVLSDSGLIQHLDEFENSSHTSVDFIRLRDTIFEFYQQHTKLGSRGSADGGSTEFRRILPKILNPISVERGIPGVAGGIVTKDAFIYQELMYNRPNWRDADKDKKYSRSEALTLAASKSDRTRLYLANENSKAKKLVLRHHNGKSEVSDSLSSGAAQQAHHIFPVSRYPELQAIRENIIALTASQHYQRAHPRNNTSLVDPEYQRTCLLAKLGSVMNSEVEKDLFYTKEGFIWMLREALSNDTLTTNHSFAQIRQFITNYKF